MNTWNLRKHETYPSKWLSFYVTADYSDILILVQEKYF